MKTTKRAYKVLECYWNNAPSTFAVTTGGWKEKPYAISESKEIAERIAHMMNTTGPASVISYLEGRP
jgi:hypothetical protein